MKLKPAACLFAVVLLSGCSGLLKSSAPPQTLYTLHAAAVAQEGPPQYVIAVPEPSVPAGFDTDRISVYLQQQRRMDYASGAAWPAPLPKILQEFIVQSAASGVTAVTPDAGVSPGWNLLVRVNDFEPLYSADAKAAPELKVSFTFTLVSLETNNIRTIFTLAGDAPAASNSLSAITDGLQGLAQTQVAAAFQKIGSELRVRPPNARHRK